MPHFDGRRRASRADPVVLAKVLVKSPDRDREAFAADKSHGVVGAAFGVLAQAVDRNDAGVLQIARDLGLEQESGSLVGAARRNAAGSP